MATSSETTVTFRGHVRSGVVVFDDAQAPPEGAAVEVSVLTGTKERPLGEFLMRFAGSVEGLPTDMAEQHDHYVHGRPKR
jgi:hypothetical protein